MRDEPTDDARVSLHRVQVAVGVTPAEGQARNQMVENKVVENDDPAVPPERLDDPAVRFCVVADVIEGDVCAAWRATRSATNDLDVDSFP